MVCQNGACIERYAGLFKHDFLSSVVAAVLQISAAKPNSPWSCWNIVGNVFSGWSRCLEKSNIVMGDYICYLISPSSDYKRRSMYCVLGENGETFLVVICKIVHLLLLREYELFVNIIHAWLKSLFSFHFSNAGVKRSSVSPVAEGLALVESFCYLYFYSLITVVW